MAIEFEPRKKVEIIIDAYYLDKVLDIIDKAGIKGYSYQKDVRGKGTRGERDGMGLIDDFRNCYIMTVCTMKELELISAPVNKLVNRVGGVMIASDVSWLKG